MHKMMMLNGVALLDGNDELSRNVTERGFPPDGLCRDTILPKLKAGDVVVDTGAALGDHTRAYLHAVGPSGRVIAFEPHPEFFRCLQFNCPTADCRNAFLWSTPCELYLQEAPGNVGASWAVRGPQEGAYGPIPALPLDSLDLDRLDFLKIDCEGADLHVLKGAQKTIARCRPTFVAETIEASMARQGISISEFYDFLDGLGYDHIAVIGGPPKRCTGGDILAWPK